jgi:hypothetical protein
MNLKLTLAASVAVLLLSFSGAANASIGTGAAIVADPLAISATALPADIKVAGLEFEVEFDSDDYDDEDWCDEDEWDCDWDDEDYDDEDYEVEFEFEVEL